MFAHWILGVSLRSYVSKIPPMICDVLPIPYHLMAICFLWTVTVRIQRGPGCSSVCVFLGHLWEQNMRNSDSCSPFGEISYQTQLRYLSSLTGLWDCDMKFSHNVWIADKFPCSVCSGRCNRPSENHWEQAFTSIRGTESSDWKYWYHYCIILLHLLRVL